MNNCWEIAVNTNKYVVVDVDGRVWLTDEVKYSKDEGDGRIDTSNCEEITDQIFGEKPKRFMIYYPYKYECGEDVLYWCGDDTGIPKLGKFVGRCDDVGFNVKDEYGATKVARFVMRVTDDVSHSFVFYESRRDRYEMVGC